MCVYRTMAGTDTNLPKILLLYCAVVRLSAASRAFGVKGNCLFIGSIQSRSEDGGEGGARRGGYRVGGWMVVMVMV